MPVARCVLCAGAIRRHSAHSTGADEYPEGVGGARRAYDFHNAENGFWVWRAKARGHHGLVTGVLYAATVAAREWIAATGEWVNDLGLQSKARFLRGPRRAMLRPIALL
jgi:hypothetical protein